jgi:hypothetical protein
MKASHPKPYYIQNLDASCQSVNEGALTQEPRAEGQK